MTAKTKALVQLELSDGTVLASWTQFQIKRRFDDAVERFQFGFAPTLPERERLFELTRKGEKVTVSIEGAPQATCVIASRTRRITSSGGLEVNIDARGLLYTASQARVDPFLAKSTQANAPLKDVILDVMRPFGFTAIEVDSAAEVTAISGKSLNGRADPIVLDELKQKDVAADKGQKALAFVRRLTTRYGLVLRTNYKGELLVCAADFDQEPAYTCVEDDPGGRRGDRMLLNDGIEERDTNDNMFSEVIVTGKVSGATKGTKSSTRPVAGIYAPPDDTSTRPTDVPYPNANLLELEPGRHTYRSTVHPFKPHYKVDKKSADRDRCQNTARVIHDAQASSAYQLRHSVAGLISASGDRIWAVDTVGHIYSASFEIDERMWLYEMTQQQDRSGGQRTMLTWIPLGSLNLRTS